MPSYLTLNYAWCYTNDAPLYVITHLLSCGFIFFWGFIDTVNPIGFRRYSVGVCSCVYNKKDHISWYWQRKNLIKFQRLRRNTSPHVNLRNCKQEAVHVYVRVCDPFSKTLQSGLHSNGALLRKNLLRISRKKSMWLWEAQCLRVSHF